MTKKQTPIAASVFHLPYDWFVDSVNGSDAYSGKSPGQAFATLGALGSVAANKRIGLAKGSYWREQLTLTNNGITVKTYGTGSTPILDASDAIAAGAWSKTVGQTSVYQATVATAGEAATWVGVWENNVRMVRATSVANCDATANSYYPSSDTTNGNITLYVHASDNSNPGVSGKVYEYTRRAFGLLINGTGCTIDGIETRRNLHGDGSLKAWRSNRILNCICRDGSKHNLLVADGCYLENVQALSAYYTLSMSMFVYNENTPAGLGITFVNCSANPTPGTSTILAGMDGYYGHYNLGGTFGNIVFTNCTAENCFSGFGSGNATLVTLNNCTTINCVNGVRPACNYTLNNCTVSGVTFCVDNLAANATITIMGGTYTSTGTSKVTIRNAIAYTGVTLICSGATFDNSSAPYPQVFFNYADNFTLNVQNCVFPSVGIAYYELNPTGLTLTSDFNTWKLAGSYWRIQPTPYTWAQWQALGYDAHSTAT